MNGSIRKRRPGTHVAGRSIMYAVRIALGLGMLLASCHTPSADLDRVGVIENMHWQLIQVGGAATIIDSTRAEAFIRFTPFDSNAAGNSGCNRFSSHYERRGNTIAFTRIISTKMACLAQEAMEQEAALFNALQATATWKRVGNFLELFDSGGTMVARFMVVPG